MALQVIGSGFGRTGTMSTKMALEQLGFGPCHHMIEVIENPAQPAQWKAVAAGGNVDWAKVFDGYNSQVDGPVRRSGAKLPSPFRTPRWCIPSGPKMNGGTASA
jgi:hypothetical protein